MCSIIKIKNLPKNFNKEEIISQLIFLVQSDEKYSPLAEEINLPNKNFYVVVEKHTKEGKIIPAYALVKDNEVLVLWVHKDYRRKGYGKLLINSLNIKHTVAYPPSVKFWESLGFISRSHSGCGPIEMYRK
jgi:GNAT superfamily N-acetyltransferase